MSDGERGLESRTYDETPDDNNTNNAHCWGLACEGLTESSNDHDHELNTI